MKKLITAAMLAFTIGAATQASAQVHVNVNIGTPVTTQPWYNTDDQYYYLPEQGMYYNVNRRAYIYQENNQWVTAQRLPARYNGYNWRRSNYVQVHERSPFVHHDNYANQYPHNYRGSHQGMRNGQHGHDDHGHGHH